MEAQLLIVIGLLLCYMAHQQRMLTTLAARPRILPPPPPPKPRRMGWGTIMDIAPTQKLDRPDFWR